jgi:hypothetical protein
MVQDHGEGHQYKKVEERALRERKFQQLWTEKRSRSKSARDLYSFGWGMFCMLLLHNEERIKYVCFLGVHLQGNNVTRGMCHPRVCRGWHCDSKTGRSQEWRKSSGGEIANTLSQKWRQWIVDRGSKLHLISRFPWRTERIAIFSSLATPRLRSILSSTSRDKFKRPNTDRCC